MAIEKRIIFLGKEDGRAFLLLPQFFRPTWQPKWIKKNPLRCDVCIMADPVHQAARAVQKKVQCTISERHVHLLGKSMSRGCSAPLMQWCFCLIDWSPEALLRLPAEMKVWLVAESGELRHFHEKLFRDAQRFLRLDDTPARSAAA